MGKVCYEIKDSDNFIYSLKGKNPYAQIRMIDDYLKQYPNNYYVMLKKAYNYVNLCMVEEAEKCFHTIITHGDEKIADYARRDLYYLLIKNNRIKEAKELLVELNGSKYINHAEYLFMESMDLYNEKKYSDAKKNVLQALNEANSDIALVIFREIFEVYSERFLVGNSYLFKEKLKKLNKEFKGNKKNLTSYYIGELEFLNSNYTEALQWYKDLLSTNAEKYVSYALLGILKIYKSRGENVTILPEFERLLSIATSDSIRFIVEAYQAAGLNDKAEEVIDSLKDDPSKLYLQGNIHLNNLDFGKALEKYSEFVNKPNLDYSTNHYVSLIKSVSCLIELQRYEEALVILDENRNDLLEYANKEYYQAYAIICKKLGIPFKFELTTPYSVNQVLNYDETAAAEHIYYGHKEDFMKYINVESPEQLYDFLIKGFNTDTIQKMGIFDHYFVKYTGDTKDFIVKFICVPETHDIVTCYPSHIYNKLTNSLREKQFKTKRMSKVDKFNQKYGLQSK